MLARSFDLVEGIIEISHQRKWLDTSISAIKYSQCIVQALWTSSHSLEQLPHIGEAEVKAITKEGKGSVGKPSVKTLGDFLKLSEADKRAKLEKLGEEQREDVLSTCALIPQMNLKVQLFVEEEEGDFLDEAETADDEAERKKREKDMDKKLLKKIRDAEEAARLAAAHAPKGDQIFEQDLVTLRVIITRENLTTAQSGSSKGKVREAPVPVHAPFFPQTIYENWWVVLTDKIPPPNSKQPEGGVNIHAFEKVSEQGREIVHELRFMAPQRAGKYEMELQVLSDCYLGLDMSSTIPFEVLPAAELPEFQMHPEDVELDNEPTLFEQVMAANVDDSSDEEEEDEEEEGEVAVTAPDAKAGKNNSVSNNSKARRAQAIVEDVDEDSDEE
jgi:translocation protein SEC63